MLILVHPATIAKSSPEIATVVPPLKSYGLNLLSQGTDLTAPSTAPPEVSVSRDSFKSPALVAITAAGALIL